MLCQRCTLREAAQKHHISYFPELTMALCEPCHKFIHSWENPKVSRKYIKYKQGDAQLFYNQKSRIEKFVSKHLHS